MARHPRGGVDEAAWALRANRASTQRSLTRLRPVHPPGPEPDGSPEWRSGAHWPIVVALARDPLRLIAWLLIRLAIGEVGLVVGLNTVGAIGTLVTLASIAVIVYVILLAIHVLSLRIEVYPDEIHAAAWPIRRRYPLADRPVTRLRVTPRRGWFGTQLGNFGIEIGTGRVHGQEVVDVLRLSPSSSMIMVPTSGTRLAIAPSSEEKLLRALAAAAGRSSSSAVPDPPVGASRLRPVPHAGATVSGQAPSAVRHGGVRSR